MSAIARQRLACWRTTGLKNSGASFVREELPVHQAALVTRAAGMPCHGVGIAGPSVPVAFVGARVGAPVFIVTLVAKVEIG